MREPATTRSTERTRFGSGGNHDMSKTLRGRKAAVVAIVGAVVLALVGVGVAVLLLTRSVTGNGTASVAQVQNMTVLATGTTDDGVASATFADHGDSGDTGGDVMTDGTRSATNI